MIAILRRLFRRRNPAAEPRYASLAITEGSTVMINSVNHRWHEKSGFVVAAASPDDPWGFITVQRKGRVELFLPRQLLTRIDFACSFERLQPDQPQPQPQLTCNHQ